MASKLQEYRRMSEEAQRQLTASLERWQSFLATASRLYKYPYHEQVMIHAQRPDATACAEFDVWNNTMRRYVRRGSKGIALIDTSGDRERLRYVFDVSDTGTRPNSRSLNLWELREEHIPAVSSMLEKNYGVPAGESLAVQLEAVASQLAREYWEDNRRDILGILEDSFLEEYDEFNVGVAFRNAAEVSISYSLMLRCGLEPENYFEHEDFMSVFDFNTPETAGALGTAVSGINQQVLREIGATIRNYEREQIAERSMAYGNDVQAERRLSDPGHQTERTGGDSHREVRADAETVSEGASSDSVEPTGAVGAVVSAPSGDRRDGAPEAGRADAADGEAGRRDGRTEAQRPAEMGGHDEYAEGAGRGDHSERAEHIVIRHIARQVMGQLGQRLALGLRDIEHCHRLVHRNLDGLFLCNNFPIRIQHGKLRIRVELFLLDFLFDGSRGNDFNAVFSLDDISTKLILPFVEARHQRGVRLLHVNQHLIVYAVMVKPAHGLKVLRIALRLEQLLDAVLNTCRDLLQPVPAALFFCHIPSFPGNRAQSRSPAPISLYYSLKLRPLLLSGGTMPASFARLLAASRRSLENGSRIETQLFGTI